MDQDPTNSTSGDVSPHVTPLAAADWSSHPEAKQRLHRILGGASSVEDWFHDRYLAGRIGLSGLSMSTGPAIRPLQVLRRGALRRLDVLESGTSDPVSLRQEAQRLGLSERVHFLKGSLSETLTPNAYDVILVGEPLPDPQAQDETLRACEVALRPGGVLWMPASFGPAGPDAPAGLMAMARRLHGIIEPALKTPWDPQASDPVPRLTAADPEVRHGRSESENAMRRVFGVVEMTPTYGSLIAILWPFLNHTALFETPRGRDLVKGLLEMDLAVVNLGRLPHHSGYLVGRKLTSPQRVAKSLGIDPFGSVYRGLQEILGRRAANPATAAYQKRRGSVSERFLEGDGIEIGALHSALPLSPKARVTYVDRLLTEGLRDQYPELSGLKLARVDVVDDGERLLTFKEESLDFIIANHMLEHCENFLGTIRNHLSKLKTGGCLYYAVPDKRYSHDEARPLTPFEHLVRDDQEGPEWSRKAHFLEWANLVEGARNERDAELRAQTLMGMNYSIHFHVWDDRSFEGIVRGAHAYLGATFTTESLSQNESELILVLRKTEPGRGVHRPAA